MLSMTIEVIHGDFSNLLLQMAQVWPTGELCKIASPATKTPFYTCILVFKSMLVKGAYARPAELPDGIATMGWYVAA